MVVVKELVVTLGNEVERVLEQDHQGAKWSYHLLVHKVHLDVCGGGRRDGEE